MSHNITISVVIPTYNRSQLVVRAIDSALGQESAATEIIVVDDGSVDNTRQVVEAYGDKVRYVYQTNAGVAVARNRGVREAQSDWIAFLDSDDYWVPGHLRRMVTAIESTHGVASLYFADLLVSGPVGRHYWDLCGFAIDGDWELKRDAGDWALMRIQPMMVQASLVSRNTYLQLGGLPEEFRTREDTLLFFKLALLYPACAVAGYGAVMCSDDDIRLTQLYSPGSLGFCRATISLYTELLATLDNIGPDSRRILRDSLGASYFDISRVFFRQKQYWNVVRNLTTSCRVSPFAFGKELWGSLSRYAGRVIRTQRTPLTHGGAQV